MTEYGRIHTDGSRSGGQPVLKPCPFCGGQAEIVEFEAAGGPWWMGECQEPSCDAVGPAFTTKAEAIAVYNTRRPTYSNVVAAGSDRIGGAGVVPHGVVGVAAQREITQADIDAAESIFWVETIIDDHEAVAKAFARHRQRGYEAGVKAAAKALLADAKRCDCAALEDRDCVCGAWDDYKSITSARAVEIVNQLKGPQ